jgi:hypothetical protein
MAGQVGARRRDQGSQEERVMRLDRHDLRRQGDVVRAWINTISFQP